MTKDPNYGRILAKRYRLAELVGEGAMGRVYRAKDTLLGDVIVAVKFLSQTLLSSKMRERFEREATICALLGEKSINVIRVRDYGVDEHEIPFYVMEFLQGENLSDIIRFQPLSLPRFFTLTRQICMGLENAHSGILFKGELCRIIHRDIKPSNIIVIQDSTLGELAKILDFGIAKLIQASESQTQSFMGTLAYCSPEQIEGKELDNRSDIYSLGVMMYEMLTGDMPILPETSSFGGWYKAHREFKPKGFHPKLNLPKTLEELIVRCLAKARQDRPQNVGEILRALESLQQNPTRSSPEKISLNIQQQQGQQVTVLPSVDETCLSASWPEDKPQQKIVFPRLISTSAGVIPTLCVMLDYEDIITAMSTTRYNQFLFLSHPHPMLLWITLLYSRIRSPRWLPCYLDLKTDKGQRIVRTLGEVGSYRILFYALNEPQRCQNMMSSTIAPNQCIMLEEWANASQASIGANQAQVSKKLLKQEYEQLKPKILFKLGSVHSDYPSDISG